MGKVKRASGRFRLDEDSGTWWEFRLGRPFARGEKRKCLSCERPFVWYFGIPKQYCTHGCKRAAELEAMLPRKAGREPATGSNGRCLNCNARLDPRKGTRALFWCGNGTCELEWRARLALHLWQEAVKLTAPRPAEPPADAAADVAVVAPPAAPPPLAAPRVLRPKSDDPFGQAVERFRGRRLA